MINFLKKHEVIHNPGLELYRALLEVDEASVRRILNTHPIPDFADVHDWQGGEQANIYELAMPNPAIMAMLLDAYPRVDVAMVRLIYATAQQGYVETGKYLLRRFSIEDTLHLPKLVCLGKHSGHQPAIILALDTFGSELTDQHIDFIYNEVILNKYFDVLCHMLVPYSDRLSLDQKIQALARALEHNHFLLLQTLLSPNLRAFITSSLMREAIKLATDIETVRLLVPAIFVCRIPLHQIVRDKSCFENDDVLRKLATEYYHGGINRLVQYCVECNLISAAQYRAIYLHNVTINIERAKKAHAHNGNVDDERKAARSNVHFDRLVEPHFKAQFNTYGLTDQERVETLEKSIRALILDYVLEHSNPSPELQDFIMQHREALIHGAPEMLEASVPLFSNSNDIGYSAWRGYNPFAPVAPGEFENLLTPQKGEPKAVLTNYGATGTLGEVTNHTASELVRKRVAYYYLAVMDPNGSPETIPTRVANFIGLLALIRNSGELDVVSCFPGHITRIGDMGYLHPVACLQLTLGEKIEAFMKPKILAKFKEMLSQCETSEARDDLFNAIIQLRSLNAEAAIVGRETVNYSDWVRDAFTHSLMTVDELFMEFQQLNPDEILHPSDHHYFRRYLLDPSYGSILEPLIECYRSFCEAPEIESLPAPSTTSYANPYEGNLRQLQNLYSRRQMDLNESEPMLQKLAIKAALFDEFIQEFSQLSISELQDKVDDAYVEVVRLSTPSSSRDFQVPSPSSGRGRSPCRPGR